MSLLHVHLTCKNSFQNDLLTQSLSRFTSFLTLLSFSYQSFHFISLLTHDSIPYWLFYFFNFFTSCRSPLTHKKHFSQTTSAKTRYSGDCGSQVSSLTIKAL